MTWQEWCVGKNIVAEGCKQGQGAGTGSKCLGSSGRDSWRLPFSHSLTYSFIHSIFLCTYSMPDTVLNAGKTARIKLSPCPRGVYILMSQLLALVTGVSPPCPHPGPLHCQPGRQMLGLLHLPTSQGHPDLCIFPAPRKYRLPSLPLYLERAPGAACSYTQTERRLGPAPEKADENSRDTG